MGYVGGVSVHVRAALVASGRGEALWRAGRRGGVMRLRDVTLGGGAGGGCTDSVRRRKQSRLESGIGGGLSSVQATVSDRGGDQEDVMAAAAAGRRRYVVGARWHEGALVMMARQMRNPALLWRYGDG